MQTVPSGKTRKRTRKRNKRGKTFKRSQARENIQTLLSTGKHANEAKRGKTWKHC